MPNISLAAHHVFTPDLSEAAVRAACTARLGMPLTGQMLPGTLPFYPSLPAIDSEHEETPLDTISELQVSVIIKVQSISMIPCFPFLVFIIITVMLILQQISNQFERYKLT